MSANSNNTHKQHYISKTEQKQNAVVGSNGNKIFSFNVVLPGREAVLVPGKPKSIRSNFCEENLFTLFELYNGAGILDSCLRDDPSMKVWLRHAYGDGLCVRVILRHSRLKLLLRRLPASAA